MDSDRHKPRDFPAPRSNGFSLVELMVVLFIMALLAAVVAYNVIPVGDKAKVVAARADIATLDQSLEMYRLDLGAYPSQAEGLAALRKPPAGLADPQAYRTGGYVKDLPDDPWGHPYQYRVPGDDGHPFEVYSLGADGQPGGEGLDADVMAKKD
ncbi:type II secretion system major pseudopilin GspG [Novosphingobium huizhouense]|uniref:type II secretion system major pseudopilin GspG n=1 Tax=Novosphingobium huizhouense TaxID=2866625 RepID=UPI001CD90DE2|nr:type II secretion system major pseudopilin GspG [Novosphingobium huizhouense]